MSNKITNIQVYRNTEILLGYMLNFGLKPNSGDRILEIGMSKLEDSLSFQIKKQYKKAKLFFLSVNYDPNNPYGIDGAIGYLKHGKNNTTEIKLQNSGIKPNLSINQFDILIAKDLPLDMFGIPYNNLDKLFGACFEDTRSEQIRHVAKYNWLMKEIYKQCGLEYEAFNTILKNEGKQILLIKRKQM